MDTDLIHGTFTVKSNVDGDWYEVSFKPDYRVIWSASPTGWVANFAGPDCRREVENLVGEKPEMLRDARLNGSAWFTGAVSRAQYSKYAKF